MFQKLTKFIKFKRFLLAEQDRKISIKFNRAIK